MGLRGEDQIVSRVPFAVEHLEKLADYHDLTFCGRTLHAEVRELAEQIYVDLRPYLVRPMEYLAEEEAYTVFCLETGGVLPAPEMRAEDSGAPLARRC